MVRARAGRQIDSSAEHFQNARLPIRVTFEFASNVTIDSREQEAKHFSPIRSTLEGRQIDSSEQQP
jgi:hypothetical protein